MKAYKLTSKRVDKLTRYLTTGLVSTCYLKLDNMEGRM